MLRSRITPVLLLSSNGLVKTQKFGNLTNVGDPFNAVSIFNEKEVDELIFLGIGDTVLGRAPDLSLLLGSGPINMLDRPLAA